MGAFTPCADFLSELSTREQSYDLVYNGSPPTPTQIQVLHVLQNADPDHLRELVQRLFSTALDALSQTDVYQEPPLPGQPGFEASFAGVALWTVTGRLTVDFFNQWNDHRQEHNIIDGTYRGSSVAEALQWHIQNARNPPPPYQWKWHTHGPTLDKAITAAARTSLDDALALKLLQSPNDASGKPRRRDTWSSLRQLLDNCKEVKS